MLGSLVGAMVQTQLLDILKETTGRVQVRSAAGDTEFVDANTMLQCTGSLLAHSKPDLFRTYKTGQVNRHGVHAEVVRSLICARFHALLSGKSQERGSPTAGCNADAAYCCWTQAGSDGGKNTFSLCYIR